MFPKTLPSNFLSAVPLSFLDDSKLLLSKQPEFSSFLPLQVSYFERAKHVISRVVGEKVFMWQVNPLGCKAGLKGAQGLGAVLG